MLSLGVDGGASSAKWCLVDESGAVVKQGSLPPVDGHLYRSESLEKFRSFTKALKSELNELTPDVISLGITGFGAPELIKSELISVFPLAKLNLSSDIALAYYSVFAPGQGVFIYAGTGSIAIHITKEGKEITFGGWGYLLGDEGAGYWIGRESLRHLLSQIESNTEFDELSRCISDAVGGSDWSSVREFVYGKDRSAVAALTPLVSRAAKAGVLSAKTILEGAAHHLVALVKRAQNTLKTEGIPLAFGGGIFEEGVGVSELVESSLGEGIRISNGNHALTAARFGVRS
jgi:N-acetylglucosamine kinase-like BadF-type ATPase